MACPRYRFVHDGVGVATRKKSPRPKPPNMRLTRKQAEELGAQAKERRRKREGFSQPRQG